MQTNENAIRKWIEALRSGDFKQGRLSLRNDTKGEEFSRYCCLGVACAIAPVKFGRFSSLPTTLSYVPNVVRFTFVDNKEAQTAFLPEKLREWLGISEDAMRTLIRMNDGGSSFEDIAYVLEKEYLKDED